MKTVLRLSEQKRDQEDFKLTLTPIKSYKKADVPPPLSARVGGRLKKAKIPFDPSDFIATKRQAEQRLLTEKLPIKQITAPSQQNVCCYCRKPHKLIHCKGECETRIHLSCLQSTCERFGKDEELMWKCSSCQTCKMCNENNIDDDTLLKCYICFSYYHVKCHGHEESITIMKDKRFVCQFCVSNKIQKWSSTNDVNYLPKKTRAFAQTRPKLVSYENKSSNDEFFGFRANELEQKHINSRGADRQPSTSTEKRSSGSNENRRIDDDTDIPLYSTSTSTEKRSSGSSENRSTDDDTDIPSTSTRSSDCIDRSIDDDADIPDAVEWSVEQVFQYFYGKFPEYAHVLKYHEIDGPSLYLLKRSDVVEQLNIKIGPALKMYGHILKMQTKCSDPTLSW